ncbi:hypothetical protein VZG28_06805 [Synechococcus elongatus IITB4]|uniref:P-loop ATPase, Sll1717 family n=1 Tax=Synechococcus elongatus TaxID=32046 RepID=UPI0030CD8ED7
MSANQFIFKSNQTIGAAAAEQDEQYLSECFVDTGVLEVLLNCEDHRCILVGRTGAGKSALIAQIRAVSEHAILIHPDSLSLAYISNSNIINFFSEAGINLKLFYRLLWQHVFVVEILKERFGIDTEQGKQSFFANIFNLITRNKKHEKALDYLKSWGDSFWRETDYRVKEVTQTFEQDLQQAAKAAVSENFALDLASAKKLTQEQREEVINRGQEVVSRVQIRELKGVINLLDEILLSDRKKKYYIVIDRLDEDWVENTLRFHLIRELIETSLEFTRIKNVKVIVALRNDLLDRVYRFTRDPGFQEEKYRTSSLDLIWSQQELTEVLDRRIDKLVKSQYTKKKVTHEDLLRPLHLSKNKTVPAINYMIERTLMRPRDLIQFFNLCIMLSNGKPMIDSSTLINAEGNYSRDRFRALVDEWVGVYPNLFLSAQILKHRKPNFTVKDLSLTEIENHCLESATSLDSIDGDDRTEMMRVIDGNMKPEDYRKRLILNLYKVSLIGLKTNDAMPISWSYLAGTSVSEAEIEDNSRVYVQPTFWRHFGIIDPKHKQ